LPVRAEANNGLGPSYWIVLIAAGVAPEDGAALVRKVTRKSLVEFHEAVVNELPDLRIAQHGRRTRIKRWARPDSMLVVHGENSPCF
jgi:hypothetical protein